MSCKEIVRKDDAISIEGRVNKVFTPRLPAKTQRYHSSGAGFACSDVPCCTCPAWLSILPQSPPAIYLRYLSLLPQRCQCTIIHAAVNLPIHPSKYEIID